MMFEIPMMSAALPELCLLGLACLVLFVDIFLDARTRVVTYGLTQTALVIVFAITWLQFAWSPIITFNGHYIADALLLYQN